MQNYDDRSGGSKHESIPRVRPSHQSPRAAVPSSNRAGGVEQGYKKRHFGPLPAKGVHALVTSAGGPQGEVDQGSDSASGHQQADPPILYLVPLLGPGQGILRGALSESGPWIGESLSDAVHLVPVGDPRGGDHGFRHFVVDVGLDLPGLEEAWDDLLQSRPSVDVLTAYEEILLSKCFRIDRSSLPTLLVFACGITSPVHQWTIPRWAQESDRGASTLVNELGKRFSKENTGPLLEDALAAAAAAPKVVEGVAVVCLGMIDEPCSPRQIHLNPTDQRILKYFQGLEEGIRVDTPGVAIALGLDPKAIGKNLAMLTRVQYLSNVRGEGYAATPAGCLVDR